MKPRQETSQGAPSPHQTDCNAENGNPSISSSSNTQKGGYKKLSVIGPTEANTGIFHPSFFVLWFTTRMALTFYQLLPHGADHLHTVLRRRPPLQPRLAIGTLKIQDDRGFGLAQDIQAVESGGFDMMILTDMKISTMAYCKNRLGYEVTCSTARPNSAGGSQGSVGIVTMEIPVGWGIESMRYHRLNVVSCKLVTGIIRTPLVCAYLPPPILEHLPDLEEALKRFKYPIFLGYLNVDLDKTRSP